MRKRDRRATKHCLRKYWLLSAKGVWQVPKEGKREWKNAGSQKNASAGLLQFVSVNAQVESPSKEKRLGSPPRRAKDSQKVSLPLLSGETVVKKKKETLAESKRVALAISVILSAA